MYPKRKNPAANEIMKETTVPIASGAALPSSFPIWWAFNQKNKIEKNENRPIVIISTAMLAQIDE